MFYKYLLNSNESYINEKTVYSQYGKKQTSSGNH